YGRDPKIITVGETGGANVKDAIDYINNDELSMVFQFQIMSLDGVREDDWLKKPLPLFQLKKIINKWQIELANKGWNSQFLGNHDFPRIVSRFGDDREEYRVLSAKMLAIFLFGLQGTPYIYQGDEIGMTNFPFKSIDDYQDVESLNYYQEAKDKGLLEKNILDRMSKSSRDNARTPMQWSSETNGGFSNAKPWFAVNPN